MKISERSWHLRYVRWFEYAGYRAWDFVIGHSDEYPYVPYVPFVPANLCEYFWAVVLIGPVYLGFWVSLVPIFLSVKWGALAVWWVVMHLFSAALTVYDAARGAMNKPRATGGPNLLVEYVRAKKRRVCPLIEVVP